MKKLLASLGLAALAACTASNGGGNNVDTPPTINDFHATPDSIHAGDSSTLSWDVSGAATIEIDKGVGIVSGTSTTVTPTVTTTYKLKATNTAGFSTSQVTVTVQSAIPKPVITAFTASPASVAIGGSVQTSWSITGTVDSIRLDPGAINVLVETTSTDPHTGVHTFSNVTADTTYTLTATNGGGSVTATASVTTHTANLQFNYTDPTSTTAKLKLVRNAALSTATHLVLDLKVGANPLSAFGAALTIPFAADTAGMVSFPPNGLTPSPAFNVGSAPTTAAAKLGAATGALPNTFTVGVAKHKNSAGDTGDVSFAAGDTLLSIAFDFGTTTPVAGKSVFTAATLQANAKYRAAALKFDGTEVAGKADVAIGDFLITN